MKKVNWRNIGRTIGAVAIAAVIAVASYGVGFTMGKQARRLTNMETKVIWSIAESKGKTERALHDFFNR